MPACARDSRGRERDDQRDGQAEGVRAGDDEHGDGALDGLVGVAEQRPDDEGDDAGGGRHVEQQRGGAVGERLRPRRATPAPRRRAAGCRRAPCRSPTASTRTRMAESVATVPATTRSPGAFGDRPRLAGDHRLVELGFAVDDLAVGRHPRRPERTSTTSPTRSSPIGTVSTCRRRRRARPRRAAARRARPARRCAWPMAFISCQWPSSMIDDQRRELPPEVEVERAELGGQRSPRARR